MLGLDVSSSSVKLVELGRDKQGRFILERCAVEPLAKGWITDGYINKFDDVAQAIRSVVRKSGTRTKNVAMALPPSAVITKRIILPGGLTDQELEVQVEEEANRYIPFPLDEVCLDFCVMGLNAASADDIDVLIAASRRDRVQDIQGLAEAAGLKPRILDIESYASRLACGSMIQSMPNQGQGAIVALFKLGAISTSLQVIRNDEVLYDREQAFGGEQLTELIVRQYGFSLEEAESKKRSGELPADYGAVILSPFVQRVVQELTRALEFFFTSTPYNTVDYVILAGGSAALPGLADAVTRQTTFACIIANPFEAMQMGDSVHLKKMAHENPAYLTSCGLALRRFLP
jgi:type IV pilus assembly protein PilM